MNMERKQPLPLIENLDLRPVTRPDVTVFIAPKPDQPRNTDMERMYALRVQLEALKNMRKIA